MTDAPTPRDVVAYAAWEIGCDSDQCDVIAARAVSALTAAGYVVVRWPPDGQTLEACADELAPYAETKEQYVAAVEQAADVLDAFKDAAT